MRDSDYRIPTDANFLGDKNISDIVYVFITYHLGLSKSKLYKMFKEYKVDMCRNTFVKKVDYLVEKNYFEINSWGYKVKDYKYQRYISMGVFKKLQDSKLNNIFKVYCLLKIFHEKDKKESYFTYNRLLEQIGYSGEHESKSNLMIKEIIEYLSSCGILVYEKQYNAKYNCREFKIIKIK